MSEWTETKAVLHELENLFSRDDDLRDINEIKSLEKELLSTYEANLKDTRDIIKGLTSEIATLEDQIVAPSEEEHAEALNKVSEKETLSLTMDQIQKAIETKKMSISKLTELQKGLREKNDEFTLNTSIQDSRTAYAISLYSKISNITWDYKAPQGHLVGTIGNDIKKEFKQFDLDSANMTPYDITSTLWEMIGESFEA